MDQQPSDHTGQRPKPGLRSSVFIWLFIVFCLASALSLIPVTWHHALVTGGSLRQGSLLLFIWNAVNCLMAASVLAGLLYPAWLWIGKKPTALRTTSRCLLWVLLTPSLFMALHALLENNSLLYATLAYSNSMFFCIGWCRVKQKKKRALLCFFLALIPFLLLGVRITDIIEIVSVTQGFSLIILSWIWFFTAPQRFPQ